MFLHSLADIAIALAYFTIPVVLLRIRRVVSSGFDPAIALSCAVAIASGVGHALYGVGFVNAADLWVWATTLVSWVAAGYSIAKLPQILELLKLQSLVLRYSVSGVGLFRAGIAPDGVRDLYWAGWSDSALPYVGDDPRRRTVWLGVAQPRHREPGGLMEDYLAVLDGDRPNIVARTISYDDPKTGLSGTFLQHVVRVSAELLLITWKDVSEIEAARASLERLAETDSLTGLSNRYALAIVEGRAARFDAAIAVRTRSLEQVRDTLGHAAGNEFAVAIARKIQAAKAADDRAFWLDGQRFLLLVRHVPSRAVLLNFVSGLLAQLEAPCEIRQHQISPDPAIGVSDRTAGTLRDTIRAAEFAMSSAQRAIDGGQSQRVVFWDATLIAAQARRHQIKFDLKAERGRYDGFYLLYQPIFYVSAPEKLAGVEALLRWESATLGAVYPDEFIPVAEQTGEIGALTLEVLRQAIVQAAAWNGAIPISVNVSPWDLGRPNFERDFRVMCDAHGIPPQWIVLEVTERAVDRNPVDYRPVLSSLASVLVLLGMDDFGAGESRLATLSDPFWKFVKIDRSLLPEMLFDDSASLIPATDEDAAKLGVFRAIVALCHDMNLSVVAEGVETKAQFALTQQLQIDRVQGWYFAKAVPADRVPLP